MLSSLDVLYHSNARSLLRVGYVRKFNLIKTEKDVYSMSFEVLYNSILR